LADESVALLLVEELHGASGHSNSFLIESPLLNAD
jgi:hypothetical protein